MKNHSTHVAEAPVDPITAAIAKYAQVFPLPDLVPDSTDEVLIAHLNRTGDPLIQQLEAKVRQAYDAARSVRFAPLSDVDSKLEQVITRLRNLRAGNFPSSNGSRTAKQWAVDVEGLRIILRAIADFSAFLARWELMSDGDRAQEASRAEQNARTRSMSTAPIGQPAVQFSAQGFLDSLRARGIQVTAAQDGGLMVVGTSKLQGTERYTLTTAKPAILAALGGVEVF